MSRVLHFDLQKSARVNTLHVSDCRTVSCTDSSQGRGNKYSNKTQPEHIAGDAFSLKGLCLCFGNNHSAARRRGEWSPHPTDLVGTIGPPFTLR